MLIESMNSHGFTGHPPWSIYHFPSNTQHISIVASEDVVAANLQDVIERGSFNAQGSRVCAMTLRPAHFNPTPKPRLGGKCDATKRYAKWRGGERRGGDMMTFVGD